MEVERGVGVGIEESMRWWIEGRMGWEGRGGAEWEMSLFDGEGDRRWDILFF